jgi:uncharacterized protein YqeY
MLIEKIKHDQLVARKNRDQIESTLLTTLIGEADMVGKNNGNRDPFDEEVISVVKKFLKGVNETIDILSRSGHDTFQFVRERDILDRYIPSQLSSEQLKTILESAVIDGSLIKDKSFKGSAMKWLKEYYSGRYDGRIASEVVDLVVEK